MNEEGGERRARGGEYTSGARARSALTRALTQSARKSAAGPEYAVEAPICGLLGPLRKTLSLPESALRILAVIPVRAREL